MDDRAMNDALFNLAHANAMAALKQGLFRENT